MIFFFGVRTQTLHILYIIFVNLVKLTGIYTDDLETLQTIGHCKLLIKSLKKTFNKKPLKKQIFNKLSKK